MGLENINRVGWMIIGTVFGLVVTTLWAWTQLDPAVQSVGRDEFENAIFQHDRVTQKPLIRDVVVQPPTLSEATGREIRIVTFERLYRHKVNQGTWWVEQKLIAETPYVPNYGGTSEATPDLTIEKYLDKVKQRYPEVEYRRGWWLVPRNAAMTGAVLGFVVIGGIWPTLLGLMSGTGLGRKNNPKYKDDRSLWKYKPSASATPVGRPQPTAAQTARVQAVADAYEQNLAQHAGERSTNPTGPATAAEVRKLDTRQLEEAKPLPNPDADDDIEVKGEYYPVMIHHKKPHEDHHEGHDEGHPDEKKPE